MNNSTPKTPLSSRRNHINASSTALNNTLEISTLFDEQHLYKPVIGPRELKDKNERILTVLQLMHLLHLRALKRLERQVAQVQTSMNTLRDLAEVSTSERITEFTLNQPHIGDKSIFDEERNKIRDCNLEQARKMAEYYLLSYFDISRRFEAQRRRMDAFESRTTRMETIFGEQIRLNQQIGDEALQTFGRFVDIEKQRIDALESTKTRCDLMHADLSKLQRRADLMESSNRELRAQLEELTKDKGETARKLLDCQNECHTLRLATDQMRHDMEVQSRMLNTKEALILELRERERCCSVALSNAEMRVRQLEMEKDEANSRLTQEQHRHQQNADSCRREIEQKMTEEKMKKEEELHEQHKAELGKLQKESTNAQTKLTGMLKQAAETHRKLEEERNRLFNEKTHLEDKLTSYKRRFVAELNRELSGKCSQPGNGVLNAALMEVIERINKSDSNCDVQQLQQQSEQAHQPQPNQRKAYTSCSMEEQQPKQRDPDIINVSPSRLSTSSASSISVFEPCDTSYRPPNTKAAVKPSGKENKPNNARQNQRQQSMAVQKKRSTPMSTIPTFTGFMPPPLLSIGSKRKSSMMVPITRTVGVSQVRKDGKKVHPSPPGGPSTSAATARPTPKFPVFQL